VIHKQVLHRRVSDSPRASTGSQSDDEKRTFLPAGMKHSPSLAFTPFLSPGFNLVIGGCWYEAF
jgi:hypothetical protein